MFPPQKNIKRILSPQGGEPKWGRIARYYFLEGVISKTKKSLSLRAVLWRSNLNAKERLLRRPEKTDSSQ